MPCNGGSKELEYSLLFPVLHTKFTVSPAVKAKCLSDLQITLWLSCIQILQHAPADYWHEEK